MDWFSITGTTLGFIGSVIFSAALLKGQQQIKDETSTFFGANPYTAKNDTESQKYYRLAFGLLIAGFAVVAGGELRKSFEYNSVFIGCMIAVTLTSIGFLIAVLLFNQRVNQHLKNRTEVKKTNFRSSVKSLKLDIAKNRSKTADEYREHAALRFKNLKDTLSQIPNEHAVEESDLLRELEASTSVDDIADSVTAFLSSQYSSTPAS